MPPLGPGFGTGPGVGGHGGHGPGFGGPGGHGRGPRHHRRARRGDVRLAVLHLLAEEPRNGYQLIQELAHRTNGVWKPSPGAIYPALAALEDEGLITPTGEGKIFDLTESGRQAVTAAPDKPWATHAAAGQSFQNSELGALWQEFGLLTEALRAVGTNATADQLEQATALLGRTRRELFGLLAADPAPSTGHTPSEGETTEPRQAP